MKNLNPYSIFWFALVPVKGVVTKVDQKKMGAFQPSTIGNEAYYEHRISKERCLERVKEIAKKGLSKKYTVYILTDKQFGMKELGEPVMGVATQKQIAESFTI